MKKIFLLPVLTIAVLDVIIAQTCTSANSPNLGSDKTIFVPCFRDIANLTTLFDTSGLTVEWNTTNPSSVPMGNYRLIVTNSFGCKDTAFITVKQDVKKWLGTVDTNWHNPANWSGNVIPSKETHVIILGGTPNKCVISASDAIAASIRVFKGGTYQITANRKLAITATCDTMPPYYELGSKTIMIDNPTSQFIQYVDSSIVIFNGNTPQLESLDTSDIILSGIATNAPYGFLRKIVAKQRTGNLYTFITDDVPLEVAFKEFFFGYKKPYWGDDTLLIRPLRESSANTGSSSIIVGFNYQPVVGFIASGSMQITPSLDVEIDISNYTLNTAKIEGSFERSTTLALNVNLVSDLNAADTVFKKMLRPFYIPATPFIIVPVLRVMVGVIGSSNISFNTSTTNTANTKSYLNYSNGNWTTGSSFTSDNSYIFTGLNGNTDIKFYVQPELEFKLYNQRFASGTIKGQLYLKVQAATQPKPACSLIAGLQGGIAANLKLFRISFLDVDYPELYKVERPLYECFKPKVETLIQCDSTTIGCNVKTNGGSPLVSRGICWGKSQNPIPIDSNKIEQSGFMGISYSSISPDSLTPSMRLVTGTKYYFRAYAINQTDTGYGEEYSYIYTDSIFTDTRDGKVYKTKKVGESTWMMEDLRFINPDGLDCTNYTSIYSFSNAGISVPTGWHIPSQQEWADFLNNLGYFSANDNVFTCKGFKANGGSSNWELVWIIGDLFNWVETCLGPPYFWVSNGQGISISRAGYSFSPLQQYNTRAALLLIKNH